MKTTVQTLAPSDTVLAILASIMFLVMFEVYMVAPLTSAIIQEFGSGSTLASFMIPAATIGLGIGALFSGFLRDSTDIRVVASLTLAVLSISAFAITVCQIPFVLLCIRLFFGLCLGSLLPVTLRFIMQHYLPGKRNSPMMVLIFSMAGGMTFGPIAGALLNQPLGWRMEFAAMGAITLILILFVQLWIQPVANCQAPAIQPAQPSIPRIEKFASGLSVLPSCFILLNGIFHSGLFVWICKGLEERYHPGPVSTGLLLLDFGLPGLLLAVISSVITKGNSVLKAETTGLSILAGCIIVLTLKTPSEITLPVIMLLSIGYNITQPLFFGSLGPLETYGNREFLIRIGCCCLFVGYGLGPIIFQKLMSFGQLSTVLMFVFLIACLAAISKVLFADLKR